MSVKIRKNNQWIKVDGSKDYQAGTGINISDSVVSAVPSEIVSVSDTGTATDTVEFITIGGVEKKLAGGGGGAGNLENGTGEKSLQQKATIAAGKLSTFGNAKNKTDLTTRVKSSATGDGAFAEGTSTLAEGYASHAEGQLTYAALDGAHAEGAVTAALGGSSHAEGSQTVAMANDSHVEGAGGTAKGYASHVEGNGCVTGNPWEEGISESYGTGAHAEGFGTFAVGNHSHAEGKETYAIGNYSHTEGTNTQAKAVNAHAGGSGDTSEVATISGTVDNTNFIRWEFATGTPCTWYDSANNRTLLSSPHFGTGTQTYAAFVGRLSTNDWVQVSYYSDVSTSYLTKKYKVSAIISGNIYLVGNAAEHENDVKIEVKKIENVTSIMSGTATGVDSFIHGTHLFAQQNSQAVVGKYNENKNDTLFEVGNGTDNANRSNAFEVKSNGTILAQALTNGTNTDSVENILGGTLNVINASDIAADGTLTDAQFTLFTNGKPTLIKGTALNLIDAFYSPCQSSVNRHMVFGTQSNTGNMTIDNYLLNPSTKKLSIHSGQYLNFDDVKSINRKIVPNYPADTGTFSNKCVNGTLSWVEDTNVITSEDFIIQ